MKKAKTPIAWTGTATPKRAEKKTLVRTVPASTSTPVTKTYTSSPLRPNASKREREELMKLPVYSFDTLVGDALQALLQPGRLFVMARPHGIVNTFTKNPYEILSINTYLYGQCKDTHPAGTVVVFLKEIKSDERCSNTNRKISVRRPLFLIDGQIFMLYSPKLVAK